MRNIGPAINLSDHRELEMAVRVLKKDGRTLCDVSERDLEDYGWGRDPLAAIEAYRARRNAEVEEDAAKGEERRESWDNTIIRVVSDEASGYPIRTYRLEGQIAVESTRPQKALREIAEALLEVANGGEWPEHLGAKIQFSEEEE